MLNAVDIWVCNNYNCKYVIFFFGGVSYLSRLCNSMAWIHSAFQCLE